MDIPHPSKDLHNNSNLYMAHYRFQYICKLPATYATTILPSLSLKKFICFPYLKYIWIISAWLVPDNSVHIVTKPGTAHMAHGGDPPGVGMNNPGPDSEGDHQHKSNRPAGDPVEGGGGTRNLSVFLI